MFKITHPSVVIFVNKIKSLKKIVAKVSFILLIYLFIFFSAYAQEVPFKASYQNIYRGGIVYLSGNVVNQYSINNYNIANVIDSSVVGVRVILSSELNERVE